MTNYFVVMPEVRNRASMFNTNQWGDNSKDLKEQSRSNIPRVSAKEEEKWT
jgi:hypothetical protein